MTRKLRARLPHYRYYGWFVCALAASFYCYEYLLRIEPSVMVHPLMRFFGVTAGELSLITAMYYYAYTPLQVLVGIITDAYGARRVLITAIFLCVIGSFGFQETSNVFIAGLSRFLIGAGSAFAFVGVLKLAAIWLPKKRFALFAGITTSLGMLGAMVGDVFMAWIVKYYGWQHVILISVFVGLFLMGAFWLFVDESREDHHVKMDLSHLFKQFLIIIQNRQILLAGFIGCLLYVSLSVFGEMWGIPFIHAATHTINIYSAEINSAVFLGWLVGSPFSGWLSDHIKSRRIPLLTGSLIAAISIAWILLLPSMNIILLTILLFIFGLSSSVEIICFAIGRDKVPVQYTAMAMATINLLIMLGGMIMQPVVGWLLDYFWSGQLLNNVRLYDLFAFRRAMILIPIMMLLAAFLSLYLKEE